MKEMPQFCENWDSERKDELFLHCCLYCIEKEFHFTFDGLWTGVRKDFSKELYVELKRELNYDRTSAAEAEEEKCVSKPVSSSPAKQQIGAQKTILSSSRMTNPAGLDQLSSAYSFSTRRNYGSSRTFVLQNPFKMLRIHSEFLQLKSEWDPDFDKNSFLEATKQVQFCRLVMALLYTN